MRTPLLALIALLCFCTTAQGEFWDHEQRLLADPGESWDWFGLDVALAEAGDLVLVGSPGEDAYDTGQAYLYRLVGGEWVEEARLAPVGLERVDKFGYTVALTSELAVVVAYGDDEGGDNAGAVYVFRFDGSGWIEEEKLVGQEEASGYGMSLALEGQTILVGARYDSEAADDAGAVFVYDFDGSSWSESQKLFAPDAGADDRFGVSVAIDGGNVLVGAPQEDTLGANSGAVYFFKHDGLMWNFRQKVVASDGDLHDGFGSAVGLSGNAALIGAPVDEEFGTNSGSAYVVRFTGLGWVEEQKLLAHDGERYDNFGCSVALENNTAVIGADHNSETDPGAGAVYVFHHVSGGWAESDKIMAAGYTYLGGLGGSVDLVGGLAIAGAAELHGCTGAAYLFRHQSNTVSCSYTCVPDSGTVPFQTAMTATLTNAASRNRLIAGRVDVELGDGTDVINWKAGFATVGPRGSKVFSWLQQIPQLNAVLGENRFQFSVMDVTPAPYNQPPLPPAGDTATDACTVTAIAP